VRFEANACLVDATSGVEVTLTGSLSWIAGDEHRYVPRFLVCFLLMLLELVVENLVGAGLLPLSTPTVVGL
jgi:hypothetical protein